MNKFIYGFFACLVLSASLLLVRNAMTAPTDRLSSDFRDPRAIRRQLLNLDLAFQSKVAVFNSTPTIAEIGEEGDFIVYKTTNGTTNLFTRNSDDRYWVAFNKLP